MQPTIHIERTLTELDFARLSRLRGDAIPQQLIDLLANSDVVPSREIPEKVITMYSQIELVETDAPQRQKLTICFPQYAHAASGFISVLSPVGLALLGLREGDVARWRTPSGEECSASVDAVLFQPEASGDYTL